MLSHPIKFLSLVGVCVMLIFSLSACSQLLASVPVAQTDPQSSVQTAVAATLVNWLVSTQIAQQVQATAASMALAQATPSPTLPPPPPPAETLPPAPVDTVAPLAPPPTVEPTVPPPAIAPVVSSQPIVTAQLNTNCRTGPSIHYRVISYLMKNTSSTAHGRDSGRHWWYIVDPSNSSRYCWVWEGSTTVSGDTSSLPVVAASEEPDQNKIYGVSNYCSPYCYGGGSYYPFNTCNPYYTNCYNQYTWSNWNCGVCVTCTCSIKWYNPCKKKPTLVCNPYKLNNLNYCLNHPWCCDP